MKQHALKKTLEKYRATIASNCYRQNDDSMALPYWQDRLFVVILTYLIPLSLLAIIPGIILSVANGLTFLAVFNVSVLLSLIFIAFKKTLAVFYRKFIFILVLYSVAVVLLYFLGSFGPGLLYLLAATVFTVLIFAGSAAYWSIVINFTICTAFGFAIYYKCIYSPLIKEYSLGAWIAVTSNLLLLCAVITALLPTIFKGLQSTIEEQQTLRFELKIEQQSLKRAIKNIHQKNKELQEFAYMTSHDLQEPLRMITGFLGLLKKNSKAVLDEKSQSYLHLTVDGAERMKKIISDLLDYSMAESKQITLESVDMTELVNEYVNKNQETIKSADATINYESLPVLRADRLSLQHLLQNLLGNSLKYCKKEASPAISITFQETNKYWEFKISDNGIGIPEDQHLNIFIAFKRLHDKSEYPGTGIGLAICKKIVENHKGKIWVESQYANGTAFYFTISKNLN